MKYQFSCSECGNDVPVRIDPEHFREIKDEKIDIFEYEEQTLDNPCSCDSEYEYNFNPEGLEVCWKGFQWAGKNYKEKKYRKKRSKKMEKKQKKEHHVPELKPNYKGQRTESWREAKNKAQKDNRPRLETTYDPLIEEEQEEE